VLLASGVEGRIAFDVRSLQEFMAAAQITAAANVSFVERLRVIAGCTHWRHVFRIAASKIFSVAELGHFRGDVLGICHALDLGDLGEDQRMVRTGAKLALDLLDDGVGASAPQFAKQLLRRALALLDLGPSAFQRRLLSHFSSDISEIFQEELVVRIQQGSTLPARGAWKALFGMLSIDAAWAENLILRYWPFDARLALEIVDSDEAVFWTREILERIRVSQWDAGLEPAAEFISKVWRVASNQREQRHIISESFLLPPTCFLSVFWQGDWTKARLIRGEKGDCLSAQIIPVERVSEFKVKSHPPLKPHPSWDTVLSLAPFAENPCRKTLACTLKLLENARAKLHDGLRLPWILSSLEAEQKAGVELTSLVAEANEGRFGDAKDWRLAEMRWKRHGISPEDLATWNGGRYITEHISHAGAPVLTYFSIAVENTDSWEIERFLKAIHDKLAIQASEPSHRPHLPHG